MELDKKQKTILLVAVAIFAILIWNQATSRTSEIKDSCREFIEANGCYLEEEQATELEVYNRLESLVEESHYPSIEAACGCLDFETIPGF